MSEEATITNRTDGLGVTLDVTHSCGHRGLYFFTGREFAEKQKEEYESSKCWTCRFPPQQGA